LKKHAERICYAHEYIGPKSSVRALVEKEEKKITKTKILFEE
jgi:hypothetical protein